MRCLMAVWHIHPRYILFSLLFSSLIYFFFWETYHTLHGTNDRQYDMLVLYLHAYERAWRVFSVFSPFCLILYMHSARLAWMSRFNHVHFSMFFFFLLRDKV